VKRIGIFSGSFDPVHRGHIGIALEAITQVTLDEVYFLVETQPRRKSGVTHPAHRMAMLQLALRSHPKLKVLELPDQQFSVAKTLPRLQQRFADSELFFIVGSDMLEHMPQWPLLGQLLMNMGLIVAARGSMGTDKIQRSINTLPGDFKVTIIINSPYPDLSSRAIRETLLANHSSPDVLPSIRRYIKQHWLYSVVVPNSS